jgi:hypothetical protein
MISSTFQILTVATYTDVPLDFPSHICYYTQDTEKYYIWRNSIHEEVFISGGSFVGLIDILHADLVIAKTASELIPGVSYRITDFQTIYDQPDFNNDGTPKTNPTVKTGPIEPIIVTAITPDELGTDAFQENHPFDTVKYILDFTTPITGTATKGRIIKRIDDRGNESDFDHRNVLFRRYKDRNDSYSKYTDTIGGLLFDEFTKAQTAKPELPLTSTDYNLNITSSVNGATPGKYINLQQSGLASISGATGAEFNVTVSQSGVVTTVEIIGEVYGYVIGDIVNIDITQIGGSGSLSITVQEENFRSFQIDIDSSFNITTSGNGQGAELRLYYYSPLNFTVAVYEPGSGYAIGDTITIPASIFTGLPGTPATDLVLTVTTVITDFIESLAIDPTKDYENYLGDTYSNYLNNEIVGYQPAFDLPNIIIGKESYANNNRFYGYLRNVNIPGRCRNNTFSGGAINFGSRSLMIENTIISGKISNFYIVGDLLNSNLGEVSNINLWSSAFIRNSTINRFIEFNVNEFKLSQSTINEFSNNQIDADLNFGWKGSRVIFNEARLDINRCQFNQFVGNTIHGRDSYLDSNTINQLVNNNLGDGTGYFGFSYNTFERIDSCTIVGSNNGGNRGHWLNGCTFKGHIKNNDFGSSATNCIFNYGFGYGYETDEFESISHDYINSTAGNVFKGEIYDCTFGRYSTGNIFNTNVSRVIFRDHLTNNYFDNLINSSNPSQPYFILDGPPELYERQNTRVFIHKRPHEYTYSIGDKYMLGNFPQGGGLSDLYWYRSDNTIGSLANLFFMPNQINMSYAWQIEPAFLGTQSGLNMSKLNTTLISEDSTSQTPDVSLVGDLMDIIKITGSHELGLTIYLPSLDELQEIYDNYLAINPTYYDQLSGTVPIFYTGKVWSSTENDANTAYAIDFSTGITSIEPKTERHSVIPIGVKTHDYVLKLEYVDEYGSTTIVDLN